MTRPACRRAGRLLTLAGALWWTVTGGAAAADEPVAWQLLDGGTPDRGRMRLSYHAVLGRVVGLAESAKPHDYPLEPQLWGLESGGWRLLVPPRPRASQSSDCIAYDSARSVLVMAGGETGQTWEFDGTIWSRRVTANSPPPRTRSQMVYDSRRGRVLLFGGTDLQSQTYRADTWEYDGVDWRQVSTATAPAPRADYGFAYDNTRGVAVLFGGGQEFGLEYSDTWEYDGTNWTRRTLAGPGARRGAELAYDAQRAKTVLFGGLRGVLYNDTWEWDGSVWRRVVTPQSPSGRWSFRMAYDPVGRRVVGFGGSGAEETLRDTWFYDGVTWTALAEPAKPQPRNNPGFAHDARRGHFVAVGGISETPDPIQRDTWSYRLEQGWTQLTEAGAPTATSNLPLVYDELEDRIVGFSGGLIGGAEYNRDVHEFRWDPPRWSSHETALLGRRDFGWTWAPAFGGAVLAEGFTGGSYPQDLQSLAGLTWTRLPAPAPPPPRGQLGFAFDSKRRRLYAYGGLHEFTSFKRSDFWYYQDGTWTQVCDNCPPGPREDAELAYDAARDRLVLYGADRAEPGHTWEYDGTQWVSHATPHSPESYRCLGRLVYAASLEATFFFGGSACYTGIHTNDLWAYGADPDGDGFVGRLDNCRNTANPDQTNTDADEAGDACDCAPADSGVFAVPSEVTQVAFAADGSTLSWASAAPGSGTATVHDVVRGSVGELPVDDGPDETCLARGIAGASLQVPDDPPGGSAWWYLVRGRNGCGAGTYGAGSDGAPRASSACE